MKRLIGVKRNCTRKVAIYYLRLEYWEDGIWEMQVNILADFVLLRGHKM